MTEKRTIKIFTNEEGSKFIFGNYPAKITVNDQRQPNAKDMFLKNGPKPHQLKSIVSIAYEEILPFYNDETLTEIESNPEYNKYALELSSHNMWKFSLSDKKIYKDIEHKETSPSMYYKEYQYIQELITENGYPRQISDRSDFSYGDFEFKNGTVIDNGTMSIYNRM